MWWSSLRLALILALTLALSACGFQLRGRAALPFAAVLVEGGNPALASDLKRAIASGSQTRIAAKAEDAQAILKITGEQREKRILSLSGAGRVNEYLLVYRVMFHVVDREGRPMLATQQIELRRDMTYDDALVLAKESEEAMLYRDMQVDAVYQILRRLNGARPAPPVEAEED